MHVPFVLQGLANGEWAHEVGGAAGCGRVRPAGSAYGLLVARLLLHPFARAHLWTDGDYSSRRCSCLSDDAKGRLSIPCTSSRWVPHAHRVWPFRVNGGPNPKLGWRAWQTWHRRASYSRGIGLRASWGSATSRSAAAA